MRSCLALLLILFASPLAAAEHHQLARLDGSLIDYYLDRPDGPVAGLLLLAQGSGCLPVGKSESLAAVRAAFPDHIALSVEKVGVTPASEIVGGFTDCPSAFHDRYTISLRVSDYLAVAAEVRARPAIHARLVLFGGSGGGHTVGRRDDEGLAHPDRVLSLVTLETAEVEAQRSENRGDGARPVGERERTAGDILGRDLDAEAQFAATNTVGDNQECRRNVSSHSEAPWKHVVCIRPKRRTSI